jgi:hypothetical protein
VVLALGLGQPRDVAIARIFRAGAIRLILRNPIPD